MHQSALWGETDPKAQEGFDLGGRPRGLRRWGVRGREWSLWEMGMKSRGICEAESVSQPSAHLTFLPRSSRLQGTGTDL